MYFFFFFSKKRSKKVSSRSGVDKKVALRTLGNFRWVLSKSREDGGVFDTLAVVSLARSRGSWCSGVPTGSGPGGRQRAEECRPSESAAAAPLLHRCCTAAFRRHERLNTELVKRRRPASLHVYIAAVFHSKRGKREREKGEREKTLNVLKNHRPAVLEAELRLFIIARLILIQLIVSFISTSVSAALRPHGEVMREKKTNM